MNLLMALQELAPNEKVPFTLTTIETELELIRHFVHAEKDNKTQAPLRHSLYGLTAEALAVASVSWGTFPNYDEIKTMDWSLMLYPLEHLVAVRRRAAVNIGSSVLSSEQSIELIFSAASGLGTVNIPRISAGEYYMASTTLIEEIVYRHAPRWKDRPKSGLRFPQLR